MQEVTSSSITLGRLDSMKKIEELSLSICVCVTMEVDKASQSTESFILVQSSNGETQFETEGSKIEDQILVKSDGEGQPE